MSRSEKAIEPHDNKMEDAVSPPTADGVDSIGLPVLRQNVSKLNLETKLKPQTQPKTGS
ncbi:MAG TPA: hypothetical protein VN368_00295 [Candidatus Methylomirabilis sp.]|nr:hypothetical protein [Candidatus Methylomirabilis sp.]